MSRILITLGIILLLIGVLWPWITHTLWPGLQKSGLGRLPGDIVIERPGLRLYLPITSSVLISLVLSLLFWLLRK